MDIHGKLVEKKNPHRWWDICIVNDKEAYYHFLGGRKGQQWHQFTENKDFFAWLKACGGRYVYTEETPFEGNI